MTQRIQRRERDQSAPHRAIQEKAGVSAGYPTIRGTRIPVWVVVSMRASGADLDEIASAYPHVERALIEGALDYYSTHPDRVDEDRERNENAFDALARQDPGRTESR